MKSSMAILIIFVKLIELFHGFKVNLFVMKINIDFSKKDKRTAVLMKRVESLKGEQINERTDLLY